MAAARTRVETRKRNLNQVSSRRIRPAFGVDGNGNRNLRNGVRVVVCGHGVSRV